MGDYSRLFMNALFGMFWIGVLVALVLAGLGWLLWHLVLSHLAWVPR